MGSGNNKKNERRGLIIDLIIATVMIVGLGIRVVQLTINNHKLSTGYNSLKVQLDSASSNASPKSGSPTITLPTPPPAEPQPEPTPSPITGHHNGIPEISSPGQADNGSKCTDVTSYDYDWDDDVLCTRPDGSQFYTNYAGGKTADTTFE